MNVKDITKALSTEFRPGDPEHFRLGVWHDGDTLENSTIKISRDLDDPTKTFIDILDKKGTGKGTVSDITKLKKKFNEIRKYLPPGDYELNADHPTKAKMYIRDFLNEPGFEMSGEKGAAKVLNKKTGKLEHKQFDTLIMKVPDDEALANQLEELRKAKGLEVTKENQNALSALRKEVDIPKGYNIEKLNDFFRRRQTNPNAKLKLVPKGQPKPNKRGVWGKNQASLEDQIKYSGRVRKDLVERFIEGSKIKPITKMHGHHIRVLQMYSPFFENLNDVDVAELAKFAAKRFPLGDVKANIALLDEDFHKQLHNFMIEKGYQVRSGVAKGTPDLGNTLESRKAALTHFFDNVQEPIEQELSKVKWAQQDKYNPLSNEEVLNQLNWMNDNEYAAEIKAARLRGEITEYGRRLGGIGDEITLPRKMLSNIGRVYTKIPGRKVAQKFLPPAVSAVLDTAGAIAATDQIQSQTLNEKLAGMFHFGAGVTGLLGVAPTPLSPLLGKVSMGLTGAGLATENPEAVAEVVDELRPDLPLQEKGREQVKKNQETNPYASFAIGL